MGVGVQAGTDRWLFTYTPWATSMHLPEGVAYTLPAGAKLRVEIAYQGTDEEVADTSEIGFYLGESGSGQATVQHMASAAVDVTPGGEPPRARAEVVLDEATAIHALWPVLDADAGSLEVTAYLPDGEVRPLLWIHQYHPQWLTPYVLTDPASLPRGTRLVLTAYPGTTGSAALKATPSVSFVRVPPTASTF
ncbi:MAG: hypothetical protein R2712_22460 [Vicinamibacterales bacterium]